MSRETKLVAGALAVVLLGVAAYMLYQNFGNVAAPPPHARAGRAGRASADSDQVVVKETEPEPLVTSGGGPPAGGPQSAANPAPLPVAPGASAGGNKPTPLTGTAAVADNLLSDVLGKTRQGQALQRPQFGSDPKTVNGANIGLDLLRIKHKQPSGVYKAPKITQHTGMPS